jgi:hypothetical protein
MVTDTSRWEVWRSYGDYCELQQHLQTEHPGLKVPSLLPFEQVSIDRTSHHTSPSLLQQRANSAFCRSMRSTVAYSLLLVRAPSASTSCAIALQTRLSRAMKPSAYRSRSSYISYHGKSLTSCVRWSRILRWSARRLHRSARCLDWMAPPTHAPFLGVLSSTALIITEVTIMHIKASSL